MYEILETQNLNDYRRPIAKTDKSLTEAKRLASRRQACYGTVMSIWLDNELVAYKTDREGWVDCVDTGMLK